MMSAIIRPLGMLKSYVGNQKEVAVEAGHSVRDTLASLGINPDLVAGVFTNDEQQSKDYILKDGDIIKVLAVIGGG
jgi:sulfur carrier protein ThiS